MIPNEENHTIVPCLTGPSPETRSQNGATPPATESSHTIAQLPLQAPLPKASDLPIDTMIAGSPKSRTQSRDNHVDDSQELTLQFQSKLGNVASNDSNHTNVTNDRDDEARKSVDLSAEELIRAVGILNGLAAMDSTDYQSALLDRTATSNSPHGHKTLLEHPQVVKLYQNIHRLHSLVTNLTAENDHQTVELLDLHKELQAKNHRMHQLEEAVTKLHKRNTKLKAQSKSNQSKAKKMFQQIQDFTAKATKRKQDEDFTKLAMQIQYHEVILNRQRTDSNFSDLDGLQDFLPDTSSIASDLDTHSTNSSVFDDAVATLRISREPGETFPPPGHYSMTEQDQPPVDGEELDTKIISRRQPERGTASLTPPRMLQSKQGNQNPFAKLLGPRTAQPYTLEFLESYELQFVALSGRLNNEGAPLIPEMENENVSTAFAVCGYHGFDSALNVKPTLGARLIQINHQDVDPTWTIQELESYIRGLGPRATMTFRNDSWSKPQKDTLQMAIQEHELLHPETSASQQHTPQQITFVNPFNRMRSQSNDSASRPGIFGKWNFPGSNKSSVDVDKSPSIANTWKEVGQRGSVLFRSSMSSNELLVPVVVASEGKCESVEHRSSDPSNPTSLTGLQETDMAVVSEQIHVDHVTPNQETIPETLSNSQQMTS